MKEFIKAKMDDHVRKILSKDTITNEDYMLLGNALIQAKEEDIKENRAGYDSSLLWTIIVFALLFAGGGHHGV